MPRCKVCKETYKPIFNSLSQKTCLKPECLAAWGKFLVDDKKKKEDKKWIADTKEKHKGAPYYRKKLEDEINHIARLIDAGHNCISCQKPPKKKNGGHYTAVNANRDIRWHLENIFLQCEYCNTKLSANKSGYNLGLIENFGKPYQDFVEYKLPLMYKINLSIPELKMALEAARGIVKRLEEDNVYNRSMDERITLRKELNLEIGIYTR